MRLSALYEESYGSLYNLLHKRLINELRYVVPPDKDIDRLKPINPKLVGRTIFWPLNITIEEFQNADELFEDPPKQLPKYGIDGAKVSIICPVRNAEEDYIHLNIATRFLKNNRVLAYVDYSNHYDADDLIGSGGECDVLSIDRMFDIINEYVRDFFIMDGGIIEYHLQGIRSEGDLRLAIAKAHDREDPEGEVEAWRSLQPPPSRDDPADWWKS